MLHPLTQNPWQIDTDRESGPVSLSHLHQLDRTRYAIQTIARMIGNSASEPDATGSPPLDPWAVTALMGGVEKPLRAPRHPDRSHARPGPAIRRRKGSPQPHPQRSSLDPITFTKIIPT